MKTPEKIKKGLECCTPMWRHDHFVSCSAECPYSCEGIFCRTVLFAEVREHFKQLESLLAQVGRERDAAVHDINRCCGTCKHFQNEEDDCTAEECIGSGSYMEPSGWQWRGVCPENSKEGTNEN